MSTSSSRGRLIGLPCAAALLSWLAARAPWADVINPNTSASASALAPKLTATAADCAPLQTSMALAAVATVLAVLTLQPRVRRVTMLAIAVMSASVIGQILAALTASRQAAILVALTSTDDAQLRLHLGPVVLGTLASIALLLSAVQGYLAAEQPPLISRRYERVGASTRSATSAHPEGANSIGSRDHTTESPTLPDHAQLWRAQDEGRDPTQEM